MKATHAQLIAMMALLLLLGLAACAPLPTPRPQPTATNILVDPPLPTVTPDLSAISPSPTPLPEVVPPDFFCHDQPEAAADCYGQGAVYEMALGPGGGPEAGRQKHQSEQPWDSAA